MACMNIGKCKTQPAAPKGRLSLSHAIRVKSAELWLMLGGADEALRDSSADKLMPPLVPTLRKRVKECLAGMPAAIDHPSLVFTQDYKSLCRERLTLFFEKGGDDGEEAGQSEGLGTAAGHDGI